MLTKSRLIVISLLISSAVIACGDATAPQSAKTSTNEITIEVGMAEQAIVNSLGTPTHTQTRSIDALTFTQSEWTDQAGTISVQFHNGKAQFKQFVAAPSQD